MLMLQNLGTFPRFTHFQSARALRTIARNNHFDGVDCVVLETV